MTVGADERGFRREGNGRGRRLHGRRKSEIGAEYSYKKWR